MTTILQMLSRSQPWRGGRTLAVAALLVVFLLLVGCDQTGQMIDQPRYDPLAESNLFPNQQSARPPVPGTVPFTSEGSPNSPELTGQTVNGDSVKGWPVPVNIELVQQGQENYNVYCIPCHGPNGEGNGKVTAFGFPKPPSLLGRGAKSLTNGDIFQVIQNGKGKMFSYAYRVKPPERWAIIAYVRALQLQNGPVNLQELTPDRIDEIGKQQ